MHPTPARRRARSRIGGLWTIGVSTIALAFLGLAGAAPAAADEIDPNDPGISIAVTALDCVDGPGDVVDVLFEVRVENPSAWWGYSFTGPGLDIASGPDSQGDSDIEIFVGRPGHFVATAWWPKSAQESVAVWTGVTVEPCQPDLTVEPTQCDTVDGTGSATARLAGLAGAAEYRLAVSNGDGEPVWESEPFTADDAGAATVEVPALPGGETYGIEVVWYPAPWEGPEPPAEDGFTPVESLVLTSTETNLDPCPTPSPTPPPPTPTPAPVEPDPPADPADRSPRELAATGTDDVTTLGVGAVMALALGAAMVLAARLRPSRRARG
jgi:hypothetical protein